MVYEPILLNTHLFRNHETSFVANIVNQAY